MIYNQHLDRLVEVDIVRDFMRQHHMQARLCNRGENHSFLLHRLPYVVEFHDALIENYLEVVLVDTSTNLFLSEGSITFCSVELGQQNREDLRLIDFSQHDSNSIFLSEGANKMYGLQITLKALDKLLPLIEAKGGLASMRDGTFDPRFDFKDCVRPMWNGLKEKYLQCINNHE